MFNYVNRKSLVTSLIVLTIGSSTRVFATPINQIEINIPTQYLAQINNEEKEPFGDRGFMKKLNLTPEQTTKIQQIRQKYQPQIINLRNNLRSEQQKLKDMMKTDQSIPSLRTQHKKMVALRQQLDNLRFDSMLEMREVLTPQQRQQFTQMMEQRQQNKNHRRPNQT